MKGAARVSVWAVAMVVGLCALGCPHPGRSAQVLLFNGLDGYVADSAVLWDLDAGAALSENLLPEDVFALGARRFLLPEEVPDNAQMRIHLRQDRDPNVGFHVVGAFADAVEPGEEIVFVVGNSSGITFAGETTVEGP
jgi:hypothetical protein